ncbi:MAG: sugar phosphate isomerase/epimerase [Anaerolineales bacterium]|nr:sugar phosphate isomerase/epimerase [Anaerolineales bacterium]
MNARKHKYSVILNNYNKPSDRFLTAGYGDPTENLGVYELIDLAGKQGVVEGLELLMDDSGEGGTWIGIGPTNKNEIKAALDNYDLQLCSIIPNLWGHWRYAEGTLGSFDPQVRRDSINLCKISMDIAADVGCPYIGLWPGHDGFDYYFEVDYQKVWGLWVEGVQELADHNPDIKIGLEPKPNEPRAYSFIGSVPKTLLMIEDIDRENVGVCLDIGHSLYGLERLAEVVALTQMRGDKLFHLHMNDNYRGMDLDMIFGSVHTFEHIELFYWLRRTGYSGFLSIDLFAYRTAPPDSVAEGVKWMQAMDKFIDDVGMDKLTELVENGDPVANQSFFREKLMGA